MTARMALRRARSADVAAILELERQSATAAHWSAEQYLNVLTNNDHAACFVAESVDSPASVIGFIVARAIVAGEWEIENIVVSGAEQRKGIATALLQEFLRFTGAGKVFLEVRESNLPARQLYANHGFIESSRRKKYYSGPEEDAVLLMLNMNKEEKQS